MFHGSIMGGSWRCTQVNGSATNCDDSEIEKYFIPGQSWEPPIWQEYVKMTVFSSGLIQPEWTFRQLELFVRNYYVKIWMKICWWNHWRKFLKALYLDIQIFKLTCSRRHSLCKYTCKVSFDVKINMKIHMMIIFYFCNKIYCWLSFRL